MQRSIGREWIEFERYEAKTRRKARGNTRGNTRGKTRRACLHYQKFYLEFLKQNQDISSIVANMVSIFHITKEEAEKYIQDVSEELI